MEIPLEVLWAQLWLRKLYFWLEKFDIQLWSETVKVDLKKFKII